MSFVLLIIFGIISRQKFMKIHTNTPNYVYKSTLQCKDSMILISHKNIAQMD